jgi:hypothetical protein
MPGNYETKPIATWTLKKWRSAKQSQLSTNPFRFFGIVGLAAIPA